MSEEKQLEIPKHPAIYVIDYALKILGYAEAAQTNVFHATKNNFFALSQLTNNPRFKYGMALPIAWGVKQEAVQRKYPEWWAGVSIRFTSVFICLINHIISH